MKQQLCSICFRPLIGEFNNAEPINKGICCDHCNDLVIIARLNQMKYNHQLSPQETKEMLKVKTLKRGGKRY